MALSKSYTGNDTRTGTAYPSAYIRISKMTLTDSGQVILKVDFWQSRAWAKSGQKVPWDSIQCVMEGFDHSGTNPKTQAYLWLVANEPRLVGAEASAE